jgi:hypothetical protein
MSIIHAIKNTLLRWKLWGLLTILVLAISYYLGKYPEVKIINAPTLLSEALSYPGYFLFWLSILSFIYAWFSGKTRFPEFLTTRLVISLVPSMIVTYVFVTPFLWDEFEAFDRFSTKTEKNLIQQRAKKAFILMATGTEQHIYGL